MNLIFLDIDFTVISPPIDDYRSCVFTPCYYTAGKFSAVLGCDKYKYIKNAAYIYNDETGETGIIEIIEYTDSLTVSGRFLEALFDNRVINNILNLSGNIEDVVYTLVTRYVLTEPRIISGLLLGDTVGFSEIIDVQPKAGETLSGAIRSILTPAGISYVCKYDYINNNIKFQLYKGLDRTQAQIDNAWAVFSTDYENLISSAYRKSSTDFKNYAYVVADDEAYGKVVVEINNIKDGDIRREIYIDASSIKSKDENESIMSLEAYKAALTVYGKAILSEHALVETVEGEVDDNGNLKYRRNYSIGDLCDIVLTDLNLVWTARITELDEVYERGSVKYIPRFGDGSLTLREFIRREMKT